MMRAALRLTRWAQPGGRVEVKNAQLTLGERVATIGFRHPRHVALSFAAYAWLLQSPSAPRFTTRPPRRRGARIHRTLSRANPASSILLVLSPTCRRPPPGGKEEPGQR